MNMYHGVTGTQFRVSSKCPTENKQTTSILLLADHQACMTPSGSAHSPCSKFSQTSEGP